MPKVARTGRGRLDGLGCTTFSSASLGGRLLDGTTYAEVVVIAPSAMMTITSLAIRMARRSADRSTSAASEYRRTATGKASRTRTAESSSMPAAASSKAIARTPHRGGADHQIIVAAELTNNAADSDWLPELLKAVERNLGQMSVRALADGGFRSEATLASVGGHGLALVVAGLYSRQKSLGAPQDYRSPTMGSFSQPDELDASFVQVSNVALTRVRYLRWPLRSMDSVMTVLKKRKIPSSHSLA